MIEALVDGDIFCYRAAFSCEDASLEDAKDKLDDLLDYAISSVVWTLKGSEVKIFLTGEDNFRYDIAKTAPYKGNRKDVEKPRHLAGLRDHLISSWDAEVSEGEEADDLIGIWATRVGPKVVVISVDKDMLQLPCVHYNPTKDTFTTVTEEEGLKFFYTQILTGDRADNIMGLKGIGPVKAGKILEGCVTEAELLTAVVAAYDGDTDLVLENGRLLWLRREEGQLWELPIV